MPGPPPKDPSLRRRRKPTPGFKPLPHEGRQGPAPQWPLPKPTVQEIAVWEELWRLPQAVEWERLAYLRTVARYVRIVVRAEDEFARPEVLTEARQLEDRLGVTPKAMQALRWETDEPLPGEDDEEAEAPKRRRLVVTE